jgi:hypothetical protein
LPADYIICLGIELYFIFVFYCVGAQYFANNGCCLFLSSDTFRCASNAGITPDEGQMINAVLDMQDTSVNLIMKPRVEITAISAGLFDIFFLVV